MIKSLLDNDLYKFTMQQAVLEHFPNTYVTYQFTNRNLNMKFSPECVDMIRKEVAKLNSFCLTDVEFKYLESIGLFKPGYLTYLRCYKFNSEEVNIRHTDYLDITITGYWHSAILWEVVLMSIISECYFKTIDTNWSIESPIDQIKLINKKAMRLAEAGCTFADFGTRRRRSHEIQDIIVKECRKYSNFVGTSNVYLAQKYKVKSIGTFAHEWVMGVSALCGLRHANKFAMEKWMDVYDANLGIALTDTYGTDSFFKDFNMRLSKTFDGVRHDSGDPLIFAKKVMHHYMNLGIDPMSKTIVFSDGLDVDTALEINEWCKGKIKCSFGIGTNLTNDFINQEGIYSKPLNMVIKLRTCEGIDVVKLSDVPGKATGADDAVKVAKWMFFGESLG